MAKVTMPQLGECVAEGTIGKWLKQPGDTVAKYEPLLEVITDKVNAEVPSPYAGVLKEILVEEGATVPNNAEIAIIETADEGGADAPAPVATEAQAGAEPDGVATVEPRNVEAATPSRPAPPSRWQRRPWRAGPGPRGLGRAQRRRDPASRRDGRSRGAQRRTRRAEPRARGLPDSNGTAAGGRRPQRPDDPGRPSPPPRARPRGRDDRRHRRRRPDHARGCHRLRRGHRTGTAVGRRMPARSPSHRRHPPRPRRRRPPRRRPPPPLRPRAAGSRAAAARVPAPAVARRSPSPTAPTRSSCR